MKCFADKLFRAMAVLLISLAMQPYIAVTRYSIGF
jgi:hypothetical protein